MEADCLSVRHLHGRAVAGARLGVLDVGAGTRWVTVTSLLRSRVGVHAVEPARAMRGPLMTRLAALPAALRERVTVHHRALDEAGLRGVADIAVRHNTIARPAPTARRALWPAVARALVPGGTLLLRLPPDRLPSGEAVHAFPEQRVGHHVYECQMVMSADLGRIRTRFDHRVREAGGVVREHTETFWMWPASRDEPADDLAEHGFVPLPGRAEPAVLAMSLGPMEEYRTHKE